MLEIKENVILAPYTTLGVGGPAEFFAVARSEEEMSALASEARERGLRFTIIGGGSNILVSDDGIKGLVVVNDIKAVSSTIVGDEVFIEAGAGEEWDSVVDLAVRSGWWGLENLSAIPGKVGATPVQNVGAYGVEVGELIEQVRALNLLSGEVNRMSKSDCGFGYRDSIFKTATGRNLVILSVTYRLSLLPKPKLHYQDLSRRFGDLDEGQVDVAAIRQAVIEIREGKFPNWKQIGTAGSFFKNPVIDKEQYETLAAKYPGLPGYAEGDTKVKVSLGWILDNICGLRGQREGNVGLYDKQALVLVNFGGATALEIKNFSDKVCDEVFKKTGIEIEMEVRML